MVDAPPVLFRRAVAQRLHDRTIGFYKTSGDYAANEATLARPAILFGPEMPTTIDNCLVLTPLEPIREGRADLVHRIQITARLKGTKADSENLAWALFTEFDHVEGIPAGFNVSWSWMFSQLFEKPDSNRRTTTYQTFYFRGRR